MPHRAGVARVTADDGESRPSQEASWRAGPGTPCGVAGGVTRVSQPLPMPPHAATLIGRADCTEVRRPPAGGSPAGVNSIEAEERREGM